MLQLTILAFVLSNQCSCGAIRLHCACVLDDVDVSGCVAKANYGVSAYSFIEVVVVRTCSILGVTGFYHAIYEKWYV